MKPVLRYGPAGRFNKQNDDSHNGKRPCVNESEERDARVREGVGLRSKIDVIPAMFGNYGNGPFIMPSLHFPA